MAIRAKKSADRDRRHPGQGTQIGGKGEQRTGDRLCRAVPGDKLRVGHPTRRYHQFLKQG